MNEVIIYHNPDCGTSRHTLAMIRNSGIEPTVIEYLKHPPSREMLIDLPEPQRGAFTKEDGEVVIAGEGRRV
ncbi:hypothetical protein [Paraburkholderia sp. HD33-4]|uniref:hypothetical protein n=1 Tax=Paraburkholderia sp. HD33-4 TaxID=2883242 RepID=UPI001F424E53|nr:hypothetical protein [Paraburkholderia sp. HD33-4]